MAEKKSPKFWQALRKWLREPNSWLSVSAAVLSIITFFLVQANPGKLQVVLPVDVGLHLEGDNVELISAITLTNTGAPRTRRHVVTVLVELRPQEQSRDLPVTLRWESEWAFVGYLEFNRKYPDEAKREPKSDDYLDNMSRATPFAVNGGQSITKLMKFTNRELSVDKQLFKDFKLKFLIKTESKEFTQTALFRCGKEIGQERFTWCARI